MILKRCPDCGQDKPLQDFADNKRQKDGKAFYCRLCFNRRSAEAYRRKQARRGLTVREAVPVPEGHKHCPDCRETKPLESFHRAPKQSGGRASYCAVCKRRRDERRRLQRLYGLTPESLQVLVDEQCGRCAVCRTGPAAHVDHDHVMGTVRGVVCFRCNAALGLLDDSAAVARRAADYLERTTWQRRQVCTGVYRLTSPRPAARRSPSSSALQHLISSRRAGSSPPA